MGRSVTPTYRVELVCMGCTMTPAAWRVRPHYQIPGNGKPTLKNLDKYVRDLEKSMEPGGVNAHLGIHPIVEAKIIHQFSGEVAAHWKRKEQMPDEPKFRVIGGSP